MSDQSGSEIIDDDDGWYVPSRILNEVKESDMTKYLIEWEDWPLGAATIEPKESFSKNPALFEQWEREKRRRRMGKSSDFEMSKWKEAREKWDLLPMAEQNAEVEKKRGDRLAAEAIGSFENASLSGGSSDEANEGPIYVSDESTGAKKKRPSKFNNRPLPESSDDDDADDDETLVVAPNGAKLPLGRPSKTANDNIGVTGYRGNAGRAPLPPRMTHEELKHKKPARKIDPNNRARRDGDHKKTPQKVQDKLLAKASGRQVPGDNGSNARFRTKAEEHRFQKAGNALGDRAPPIIPGKLRSLADGGRWVDPAKRLSLTPLSTAPAAPAHAPSANRNRESRSPSNDAGNVEDEDATQRSFQTLSTAMWPRIQKSQKPTERELLKKREEDLKKQISDAKSTLENATPTFGSPYTEAVVFNARRISSTGSATTGTLLPAVSSLGLVQPSNTLGAIADATSASNPGQSRPRVHLHRPKADPLFCQSTKERIASQDRPPRPIQQNSAANMPANFTSPVMSPPGTEARPVVRNSISWQEYQASKKASSSMDASPTPLATNSVINDPRRSHQVNEPLSAVAKVVSEELLGCQYESLLPHLADKNKETENAYYYLLFPAIAAPLADGITKWLRNSSNWAKVFHCQQPGSWTRFVELTTPRGHKLNGGCLIIHNSLKRLIPRQPQLTTLLSNGNNMVWCADETAPNRKILTHVFQAGGTILITPKMYETQPQKTAHLLDWFFRQKLPKTRGKIWKLALLRDMTVYLHDLWQHNANLREKLIEQYMKGGESEQSIERILMSRTLSRKDIECMHQNLHLVQKIKQYGVTTNAVPGTKEAETVFVELSLGVKFDDDVGVIDGFASHALTHWKATRKWVVIGTGESQNHKEVQRKEPQATGSGSAKQAEEQHSEINKGKQPLKSLAESVAGGVADDHLKKSLGDANPALRFHDIDLRDGNAIESTIGTSQMTPTGPDRDGDTAMEDASQESGEVDERARSNGPVPISGAAPPTPPETASSPSKLQSEIAATEFMMKGAASIVTDMAPPLPPDLAPPQPPAKAKFNLLPPNATRKSPPGPQPTSEAHTPGPALDGGEDVDMTVKTGAKPRLETRPTLEWYHEKRVAGEDWKHIWVMGYDKAVAFFQIRPMNNTN